MSKTRIIRQIESFLSNNDLEIYYIHGCYLVLAEDKESTYKRRKVFESYLEEKVLNFLQENYPKSE